MKIYQIIKYSLFIVPILIGFLVISSCRKDKILTDSNAKLSFSADTVLFDTVFTTVGSVTKEIKVHNPYNQKIKISSIRLADGTNSNFRINVDGVATTEVNDVELEPNDSIYIFVKVTVDPNNSNSPLVISDSIMFETNGNMQQVQLVAWGQDAYYHTPDQKLNFPDGSFLRFSYAHCKTPWKNDKPHILYGYVIVDSDSILSIPENTKIYLHKNAVLWVYKDGTLQVKGMLGNPVTFQGDRLEQYYKDKPGQWGKIWLSSGSKNNEVNYAVIKNGYIGIHVDTTTTNPTQPTLTMDNTIIENMGAAALLAQGSWVVAKNCVFGNCAQYAVVLNIGGKYDFRHCTIGNYYTLTTRQTPSLVLNNWYLGADNFIHPRDLTNAYFGNCIIYGALSEELLKDSITAALFNYTFDHCLVKTQTHTNYSRYINCIINSDPAFKDYTNNDYQLNTGSAAIDKGLMSIADYIPFDILRHNRTNDAAPDMGAYEKK
jgi:hypothetical protein